MNRLMLTVTSIIALLSLLSCDFAYLAPTTSKPETQEPEAVGAIEPTAVPTTFTSATRVNTATITPQVAAATKTAAVSPTTAKSPTKPAAITITEFAIPSGAIPGGIAAGPDGNLWFTEPEVARIARITLKGVITEFPLPDQKSLPIPIVAGRDGNLWFLEVQANRIGRISTTGAIKEFLVPTASSIPLGLFGLTVGPDGNVWFTEMNEGKVGRITPGGAITEFPLRPPWRFQLLHARCHYGRTGWESVVYGLRQDRTHRAIRNLQRISNSRIQPYRRDIGLGPCRQALVH